MKLICNIPIVIQFIVMLLLCFVGYIVGTKIAFLPWSADVALFAMPFFGFGDKMKFIEEKMKNGVNTWIKILLLVVISFL